MPENIITILSMTFGFSDSEDRLWLRLTLPEENVQFWVTRRFILRWYQSMAEALFDTVQLGQAPAPHQREVCAGLEYHEAVYGDQPALSKPNATIAVNAEDEEADEMIVRSLGVLNGMEIQANNAMLSFFLGGGDERYFFEVDRISAYRMLQVMRDQISAAAWDAPVPKDIRHAWCESDFMARFKEDEN